MTVNIINFVRRSSVLMVGVFLMVSIAFLGVVGHTNTFAIAAPINNSNLIATITSSLSKEVTGKAKQDIGTVQKNVGKVSGQLEGAANQVKGRATRDAGKAQAKVEDTQQLVKNRARKNLNTTQNAADRVGNRLSETTDRVGDKVTEATENTVDSIKTFFGQ